MVVAEEICQVLLLTEHYSMWMVATNFPTFEPRPLCARLTKRLTLLTGDLEVHRVWLRVKMSWNTLLLLATYLWINFASKISTR